MTLEVVWLLLALETGKFSGSIQASFHASPEACQQAAETATTFSHQESRFSSKIIESKTEAQSWSCVPMIKTDYDAFNGGRE